MEFPDLFGLPLDVWHSNIIPHFLLQLPVARYCILHIPKASLPASDVSGAKLPQERTQSTEIKENAPLGGF